MAVADVFTAIAEDRPYRRGMAEDEMLRILYSLAAKNHLDREIVELLKENLPAINDTRLQAQELAQESYGSIITS
jgi:HD-GYP domain-containing protein (c-di-GMP phosphodiesterase class II)